jgi:hypothetical protein
MKSKPAHPGYAELIRTLAAESRRHRQTGFLGLALALLAGAAWAYTTGQRPLLVVGLAAAAAAVLGWLVAQRIRLGARVIDRVVEHPEQVTAIEQIHRSRAVFLRLRLGAREHVDLKVHARQAGTIAHQLKGHCRHASLHVR